LTFPDSRTTGWHGAQISRGHGRLFHPELGPKRRSEATMTTLPASLTGRLPVAANLLRVVLTYIVPALAVVYVVLAGLWLVPDTFAGMYGNYDGRFISWSARGILEWSSVLDFSPFSPLVGTGSLFIPFLPWLNPGALALAIPAPLPFQHLTSMLVYLAELSASLYLLCRHLEFSREQALLATILYICIFFIPFWGVTWALPWYTILPMSAHLIAAMNVATIALIRVGYERLAFKLIFGLVFLAALFVAFASAPVNSMTYIPTYSVLWIAFLIPYRAQRRAVLWRWGTIAFALLILGLIGVPLYLAATAMTSARADPLPPMFHPGWQLLSPAYWENLLSVFPLCSNHLQLMCPSTTIGWFEIAVLAGAIYLVFTASGAKRHYGVVIIALLALLHFYALVSTGLILGRLHVVSTPYLMWAFFPLSTPAAIATGSFIGARIAGRRVASSGWTAAAVGCFIAAVVIFVWIRAVLPYQPRLPGRGPLGLPPIAHVQINKGPIVDYLQRHIGLKPGTEFRGYASTFLGAPDGLVRKLTKTSGDIMTYDAYVAARDILFDRFGNSFQSTDLWNNDIPTFEEYGQWVSKQMYYFNRDLMAQPNVFPNNLYIYIFRPLLLRGLGVRFVIADGTLTDPSIERVTTESGQAGSAVNLYEIKGANLGQFSPTQVTWKPDYPTAVAALREQGGLEKRVVLLGVPERLSELVSASRSRLVAVSDGYLLTASARGWAIVVLPVQFSHCWQIESANKTNNNTNLPRVLRANIIQTGILFKDDIDVRLRFDFEPWKASCRLQDARDLTLFGLK
jgi:hypothetical protein